MADFFISYRRDDTAPVAGRLFDRLSYQFPKGSVFIDVHSIPYGVDFREHIRRVLGRCHVVLALLGNCWLEAEENAMRRIDDPGDYVRLEIVTALSTGIPIIPVLAENARMPKEQDLPKEMAEFVYLN